MEGLSCRPKYWPNIIHRFDDQNFLTSKCIENWALFKRLTHSQRSALSPPGPPGVCPTQSPRKPALFCPVQECVNKHLSAPGLYTLEKISVSLGEAQPFGKFTPAERAWVTLYDNSVYGNWLRPKGVAKVSGILEGSDFNIRSIYERLRKGPKRKN